MLFATHIIPFALLAWLSYVGYVRKHFVNHDFYYR